MRFTQCALCIGNQVCSLLFGTVILSEHLYKPKISISIISESKSKACCHGITVKRTPQAREV